ncbi:MAG: hypothetical protein LBT42_07975, partial [Tannerella sp.]|nr:hypothetical protein [Tannerella sp.]
MKRKNCIIMLCMAFVMSDNVMSYAQHGVLLQKNHSGHVRLDDNGIPGKNGVLKTEKRITVNLTGDEIQPRRGDAITVADMGYIVDSTNVNNEFGAGESAFIRENRIQRPRNKPGAGYDSLFNNPWNNPMPLNPTLQLGSEYSANIVINTYNADAYASGAVRLSIGGIVDEQYKDVNTSLIDSAHIRNYTKMITPGDIYDLWSYGGCSNINWGKSKSYPEGEEYGSDRIGCMVVSGISSTKLTPNPVISYGNLSAGAADGIYAVGAVIADELAPSGSSQAHIVDIYLANHFYTTDNHNNDAGHWRTVATSGVVPYTSTANSDRDNGVDLLQKAGQPAINT